MNQMTHSKELFEEAVKYMPGGVNSPVPSALRRGLSQRQTEPVFLMKTAAVIRIMSVHGGLWCWGITIRKYVRA